MTTTRQIIRNHAAQMGAQGYRITKSGQVDYYGRMPNSAEVGWYFVSWDADDHAKTIEAENDMIDAGLATR